MSDEPQHDPESPEEQQMAEWLDAAAPVPGGGFRGALGRYLRRRDPGNGPRPAQLRLISSGCVAAGAVLLFFAALQATGAV